MEPNGNINNNNEEGEGIQYGNMYCYNPQNSNSINEPPKDTNAVRRSSIENIENQYQIGQNNINNDLENQQSAIRRSIGERNPNADYPNYAEKSSEQRIPNIKESNSPFQIKLSHAYHPQREPKNNYYLIYILIGMFQAILITLIATLYKFGDKSGDPKNSNSQSKEFYYYYHFFKDVHLMIFIGFGLLYTALKDHQWSSIVIVLFTGIFSFEISFFWNYLWWNTFKKGNWSKAPVNFEHLSQIDFTAATVLISLGSLIGKLSISQLLIMSFLETFSSSLNYYLCYEKIKAVDNGGSLYIHTFGAIFGISVAISVFCREKVYSKIRFNPHLRSDYYSNMISLIGSLFLWLYFPSFNTARIQCNGNENDTNNIMEILRYRGIVNTYFSMIGSVIGTFVISPLVSSGKINIAHLLNASYVGGIIIGGSCTICSSAWGAILIGFIGGCLSVLGLWKLKKILKDHKLDDTFGILFTFGIPGLLGGFLNSIFMGNFKNSIWAGVEIKDLFNSNKRPSRQAGIQIAAIFITIGLAGVFGIFIGFMLRVMKCQKNETYFIDSELCIEDENIPLPEWKYQNYEQNLSSSGNKINVEEREVNIQH